MISDVSVSEDYGIGLGRLMTLWRQYMGLSQGEVAFLSDLDQSYVSMIERGVVDIRLSTFEKILAGFQMEAIEFLQGPQHTGPRSYVFRQGDRTQEGERLLAQAQGGYKR